MTFPSARAEELRCQDNTQVSGNRPPLLAKYSVVNQHYGQREHIEIFSKGNLYFANAVKFWGIEDKPGIKGQGDQLEAGTMLFAQKITACSHQDNSLIAEA